MDNMINTITIVNGTEQGSISVFDRGLAYGDGIFETMLSIDGRIPLWHRHQQRLQDSLQRLAIPEIDMVAILALISPYLKANAEQIIKLIVTRGSSARGYSIPEQAHPTTIIYISERDNESRNVTKDAARLDFCSTTLGYQPLLAGIKHLNRLEQVMARKEVQEAGLDEGLMCGLQGEIIEATAHNIFAVQNNILYTPELNQAGVAGIMRSEVIRQAEILNIPLRITKLERDFILAADELFLCNSIHGIWPVCELGRQHYTSDRVTYLLKEVIDGIMGHS